MKTDHRDEQTYDIIGAAMEVHRELGSGFLEAVYQDALVIELKLRGIQFERERLLPVHYKGSLLPSFYRADFVCFGEVVVEIKSLAALLGIHEAQTINYLKATGLQRALLFNFGTVALQHKRLIRSHTQPQSPNPSIPTPTSAKSATSADNTQPGVPHAH